MSADYVLASAQDSPCTPTGPSSRTYRRRLFRTLPSSPLTATGQNDDASNNASSLLTASNTLASDDFPSPSSSRAYPISPSMGEYLRNRRERFFTNAGADNRSRTAREQQTHQANGGRSRHPVLSTLERRTTSRRSGPHLSPFALNASTTGDSEENSSGVMRQQFRQRCQALMVRERQRHRDRRLQDTRHSDPASPHSRTAFAGSDELSSSDAEDGSSSVNSAQWTENEEDEEMVRRIMMAEYRRLLRDQERQGEYALGWLGPDEVAWLEEEMRKEGQGRASDEMEPPPDLEDEDDALCALYEEAYRQSMEARGATHQAIGDCDEDFSWVHDVDLDFNMDEEMDIEA